MSSKSALGKKNPDKSLSSQQKAAVILSLLGKETAKPVFDHFEETELRLFGQTLATLGEVDKDTIAATIEEFFSEVSQHESSVTGNVALALDMLNGHIGDAGLSRLRMELDSGNTVNIWRKIAEVAPETLGSWLACEHPQVAAVALAKLDADLASSVLDSYSDEGAQAVVSALTRIRNPGPETVDAIGKALAEKLMVDEPSGAGAQDPTEKISILLNYIASDSRDKLLEFLDNLDPEMAAGVRRKMFTFPDIASRIDKKDIAKITRAVDQGALLKALAGAAQNAPQVREMILTNISSRLAEQLREAIADLGIVNAQEADLAQTEIVKAIRKLESAGELSLLNANQI